MAKEICISSTPHETRLAILEDDQLAEVYYERENEYTLAGSIYNGRVTRVLPGMQSAFVDIGLERDAFLYVTDFLELEDPEESDEIEKATVTGGQGPREVGKERRERSGRNEGRGERSEGRNEGRRERRPEAEAAVEEQEEELLVAEAAPAIEMSAEPAGDGEASEGGARRWRGRRRRRRGGAVASEPVQQAEQGELTETEETAEEVVEAVAPARIHATAQPLTIEEIEEIEEVAGPIAVIEPPSVEARPERRERRPRNERIDRPERVERAERAEAPVVKAESFVLPGESLSKYGGTSAPEPEAEAKPVEKPRPASTYKPSTMVEEIQWDGTGLLPGESLARHKRPEPVEQVPAEPEGTLSDAAQLIEAAEAEELIEEEISHEASHNIDPLPPQTFRLFGLGSKKKKETTPAEEELEEEELSAPAPAARTNRREESARPSSVAAPTGGRIQLEEGGFDEESDDEQQPSQLNQRRERGGRGRRGRGERGERQAERPVERSSEPVERNERSDRSDRSERNERPAASSARRVAPSRRSAQTQDLPIISDLLKPGQEILVQIAKEPIAKKGARITSHIALPGRFLVFMPTVSHVGVSRKIASDEERQRLKRILISERGEQQGGFIVRTAAEGASEEELRADLRFLLHLWSEIKLRSDNSKSPALIYHDLSLIERILRDQVSSDFSNIWVDSEADYERIVRFLNRFSPNLVRRVKLYTKETPLFEHFGIEDEISKALRSKVWLKSGGSIVINQTEALVAIDINTGKYVGKTARLEDTIVKTNLDAIPEIVRQIRLRDLGGIIIIDFIDMDERKNRYKVMAALEEALKTDRAPTKVLQFNDFGLVAITRKRVKQSLERTLSVPCHTCQATGMVKSPVTVCNEIFVEMRKMKKHFESDDIMLRVHPETVKVLKANSNAWINEFEELTGKSVLIKSDPALHPEQFDIQG